MTQQLGNEMDWLCASEADFPTLHSGELHLWWLPLTLDDDQKSLALDWLSDIQRDKYARRREHNNHQSYLAGRYYLLKLLGLYVGCQPSEILLSYNRLNKPYLSHHDKNIEFNFTDTKVSHSSYGVFAFSRQHELGVDLEARSRRSNFNGIAKSRFSDDELSYVSMRDGTIDPERFLAIWTRKEAYGKARGLGINFKMNQCPLYSKDPSTPFSLSFKDEKKQPWNLEQIQFGEKLVGAVVYGGNQSLSIKSFNSLATAP